jgi:hypothetical protein
MKVEPASRIMLDDPALAERVSRQPVGNTSKKNVPQ